MGCREKKERRKKVIVETKYETDGFKLLTVCPFHKKTKQGNAFPICVGSGSCRECKEFVSDDEINLIVSCTGK